MTRDAFFYLIMALVIGISVWLFRVDKGIKKTQEFITEQTEQLPRRTPAATSTQIEKIVSAQKSETKARVQAEKESIQQRLTDERQRLDKQRQDLENMRALNQQQVSTTSSSETLAGSNQLRELAIELRSYDNLEIDINRRADEVLRQQNSEAQVIKDGLDEAIRTQENLIKQTQEQVTYWQVNYNYTTEQLSRLAEAQAQLESQKKQLENLRQQRLSISSQVLANSQAIQLQKERELGELSQSRVDLQNEILSLNEDLARLQEEQNQQRMSQMSLGSQILQTQRAYQQQQEKVQVLESSLKQKNEELNLLR